MSPPHYPPKVTFKLRVYFCLYLSVLSIECLSLLCWWSLNLAMEKSIRLRLVLYLINESFYLHIWDLREGRVYISSFLNFCSVLHKNSKWSSFLFLVLNNWWTCSKMQSDDAPYVFAWPYTTHKIKLTRC